MTKTILLAVDAARSDPGEHVAAAAEMTRQLALATGDDVVVLHVHEYAVGRWGRAQVDCHEGPARASSSRSSRACGMLASRSRASSARPTMGTWPVPS